jgi:hypothetical protein
MSSWKKDSWGSKETGKRDKSWQEKSPSKKQATGKEKAAGSTDGGKQRLATPPRGEKFVHPFLHQTKKVYLISTLAYKRSEPHHQGKVRLPDYYIIHLQPDSKVVLEDVNGEKSPPHGKWSTSAAPEYNELEFKGLRYPPNEEDELTGFTLYRVQSTHTWITKTDEKEKFIVCKFQ